jgi:hypothetical protein
MRNLYTGLATSVIFALSIAFTWPAQAQPLETRPAAIQEFVRQVYIEGVPYEKVVGLSRDAAIPVLLPMLNDPREDEHWPNIVVTLGMLGDDRAVAPLVAFITRRESDLQLSRSQSIAKTSAVMALGYVVNRTGNREALKYLEEGIYPEAWEARNVLWKSSFFPSDAERNDLATLRRLRSCRRYVSLP